MQNRLFEAKSVDISKTPATKAELNLFINQIRNLMNSKEVLTSYCVLKDIFENLLEKTLKRKEQEILSWLLKRLAEKYHPNFLDNISNTFEFLRYTGNTQFQFLNALSVTEAAKSYFSIASDRIVFDLIINKARKQLFQHSLLDGRRSCYELKKLLSVNAKAFDLSPEEFKSTHGQLTEFIQIIDGQLQNYEGYKPPVELVYSLEKSISPKML